MSGSVTAVFGHAAVVRYLRRTVYPVPSAEPVDVGDGAEIIRTPGPEPAFALHTPPVTGRTVVYFHGNAQQLSDAGPLMDAVVATGLGFVAVEYPGYGLAADQQPSESSLYAAAVAILEHLRRETGLEPEQTVLLGHSLGTAVAVEMATRGYGGGLVLSAPFTSTAGMVRHHARFVPARLFTAGDRFDSLAKAGQVEVPTLLIHGADDVVVPTRMSAALAENLRIAHRVVLPGRGHNDLGGAISQAAIFAATEAPDRWGTLTSFSDT